MSIGTPTLKASPVKFKTGDGGAAAFSGISVAAGETLILCIVFSALSFLDGTPAWSGASTFTAGRSHNGTNVCIATFYLRASAADSGNITLPWDDTSVPYDAFLVSVTGLNASAYDKENSATGSSTAPNSGATPTTTKAVELVLAFFGVNGPIDDATPTLGGSLTRLSRDGMTGGIATTNFTGDVAYRLVSSTGAFTASETLGTSRQWCSLVETFSGAAISAQTEITDAVVVNAPTPLPGAAHFSMPAISDAVVVNQPTGIPGDATAPMDEIDAPPTVGTLLSEAYAGSIGMNDAQATLSSRNPTAVTSGNFVVMRASDATIGDGSASTVLAQSISPGNANPAGGTVSIESAAMNNPIMLGEPAIDHVKFRAIAWRVDNFGGPPNHTNFRMRWNVGGVYAESAIHNDDGDVLFGFPSGTPLRRDDDGIDPDDTVGVNNGGYFVGTDAIATQPNGQPWDIAALNALANVSLRYDYAAGVEWADLTVAEIWVEVYVVNGTAPSRIELRQTIGAPIRHISRPSL